MTAIRPGSGSQGNGTNRGFIDSNGVFTSYTDPNTPHGPGSMNQILGINDDGIAVGFYNDAAGNSHGLHVEPGDRRLHEDPEAGGQARPPPASTTPETVVGFDQASDGIDLELLVVLGPSTRFQFPGGSSTEAFGINSSDQIVGSYLDGSGVMHGFVLDNPTGTPELAQRRRPERRRLDGGQRRERRR